MQPFVTITLSENPTPDQLYRAKAILAVMHTPMRDAVHDATRDEDDAPVVTTDDIKRQLAGVIVPPPVAPETAFQVVVPPPGASAPQHDSRGFPWDERIHSGNKTVNADGTWKKRKNVPEGTTAAVEQELAAAGRTAAPAAPLNVPPAPSIEARPATPQIATLVVPPPPAIAPTAANDFAGLMKRFSDGVAAKQWPPTTAVDMAKAVGLATTLEINKNPALIPRVNQYLDMRAAGLDHDSAVAAIG